MHSARSWRDPDDLDLDEVDRPGDGFLPADPARRDFVRQMQRDFTRFIMEYRFAVDEVLTKVTILREEFLHLHRYNPIEHVSSRVKTPESILRKVVRKGCERRCRPSAGTSPTSPVSGSPAASSPTPIACWRP